jgi:mRNA interferase MazF
LKRGDIYLVNFKKKYNDEFGKIRPALIFQTDILNEHIDKLPFKTVAVIPLSTQVLGGHFRVTVDQRDHLEKQSEIVVNWICTLDYSLIYHEKLLATLTADELKEVEEKLMLFLGYKDK